MYKWKLLKKGDILLFVPKPGEFVQEGIAFATNGQYCHVGLYAGNFGEEGRFILDSNNGQGVAKRALNLEELTRIDVYRLHFMVGSGSELLESAQKYLGREYDSIGLVPSWFHSIVFKIPFLRRVNPLINDKSKYFCSELVAQAMKDIGIPIENNLGLAVGSISPNALATSNFLFKVSERRLSELI